jgi:curved DNA-binding protein CbpA
MGPDPKDEEVELDDARKRFVEETHARLGTLTHYQLLELQNDADRKEVKRAYFRLAAFLHPDRFFGKKLGRYKAMMEALFAKVTEAHETLSSAQRRAAYDGSLGLAPRASSVPTAPAPAATPKTPAPPPPPKIDPKVAAERAAAMDALKQRFLDGKGRAKQHADAGARARAAGDMVAAAEAYRAALQYSPSDEGLRAAYEETSRAASERLHESHVRKAQLEERYGHWAEAAAAWKLVLDARPNDAQARERLTNALTRAKGGRP